MFLDWNLNLIELDKKFVFIPYALLAGITSLSTTAFWPFSFKSYGAVT